MREESVWLCQLKEAGSCCGTGWRWPRWRCASVPAEENRKMVKINSLHNAQPRVGRWCLLPEFPLWSTQAGAGLSHIEWWSPDNRRHHLEGKRHYLKIPCLNLVLKNVWRTKFYLRHFSRRRRFMSIFVHLIRMHPKLFIALILKTKYSLGTRGRGIDVGE